MLTNTHLRDQASELARQASDLATFLKSDPTLRPLDLAAGACELDRIKVRLKRAATALKTANKNEEK
jgi:hypothetical protein